MVSGIAMVVFYGPIESRQVRASQTSNLQQAVSSALKMTMSSSKSASQAPSRCENYILRDGENPHDGEKRGHNKLEKGQNQER